jgi:hypothetical protein
MRRLDWIQSQLDRIGDRMHGGGDQFCADATSDLPLGQPELPDGWRLLILDRCYLQRSRREPSIDSGQDIAD